MSALDFPQQKILNKLDYMYNPLEEERLVMNFVIFKKTLSTHLLGEHAHKILTSTILIFNTFHC